MIAGSVNMKEKTVVEKKRNSPPRGGWWRESHTSTFSKVVDRRKQPIRDL
jgi:hypothetical protein